MWFTAVELLMYKGEDDINTAKSGALNINCKGNAEFRSNQEHHWSTQASY